MCVCMCVCVSVCVGCKFKLWVSVVDIREVLCGMYVRVVWDVWCVCVVDAWCVCVFVFPFHLLLCFSHLWATGLA